jgi:hypothetical protein
MKRVKRNRAKKSSPKHNLSLPDLDQSSEIGSPQQFALEGISERIPARDGRVRRLVLLRTEAIL